MYVLIFSLTGYLFKKLDVSLVSRNFKHRFAYVRGD